jgi:stage II sporulation protein P
MVLLVALFVRLNQIHTGVDEATVSASPGVSTNLPAASPIVTESKAPAANVSVSGQYPEQIEPYFDGKTIKAVVHSPASSGNGQTVLIYHTHSEEGYAETAASKVTGAYYTRLVAQSVVGAGRELSAELARQGYKVYHVINNFTYAAEARHWDSSAKQYQRSYAMLNTLCKSVEFDLVIDVHRDSNDEDQYDDPHTITIGGDSIASIRFCVAKGAGMAKERRNNVRYNLTSSIAEYIQQRLNSVAGDIAPRIYYVNSSLYNQDVAGKFGVSVLFVEAGFDKTPTAAVFRAMPYLANAINQMMRAGVGSTAAINLGDPIMGESVLTARQLADYAASRNAAPKLNCALEELAQMFLDEGAIEGVRGDVAFCQSLLETGFFNYGNLVLPEQNNYGGIGAVNDSAVGDGAWFDSPQEGVRAQTQHLKAYASTSALVNDCVDPRFGKVVRGSAPTWQTLNGKWALPGDSYGQDIYGLFEQARVLAGVEGN